MMVHIILILRAANMNAKNEKWAGTLSILMLYFEVVEFLKDLENIQKFRDAKYQNVVDCLEMDVLRGAVKKASFQKLKILGLFLNHMEIFSLKIMKASP